MSCLRQQRQVLSSSCWSAVSNFNLLNGFSNKNTVRSPFQNCKLHQLFKDSKVISELRTNRGDTASKFDRKNWSIKRTTIVEINSTNHITSQLSVLKGVHCYHLFLRATSSPSASGFFGCFRCTVFQRDLFLSGTVYT